MSLPQDKNDYIECGIIGIDGDENNNSNHVAHTESNNRSSFIATDDYSSSKSDRNEGNKSIDVPIVFASEDYNSKNNNDGIMLESSFTVAKQKKKKKNSSSNANENNEKDNPSSIKPKDKEEEEEVEKEEEGGEGCNNKQVAVLVLPPGSKNAVNCNINTNNGSSTSIISKSNNNILVSKLNNNEEIVHFPDSILEKERHDNGASNKKVTEQRVLPSNEDDFSNSSTFSSKPYPADTYSFVCLYGPVENPGYFSYGLMVYLFQMTFLVLMVLSVTHPDWSSNGDGDNPDGGRGSILARIAAFVPSHVSPLVRATQITATLSYVIFADSTVLDVVTAVELFPRFNQATSDDKLGCMIFASILRLSQGIFAITVTLLLIVTSSTTIEIILNFTAINFISTLDNVGFKIIKWGKYGPKFEEEAKRIEKLPLPRCIYRKYKHVRYLCTIIPVGVILLSLICFMIILQESNNHWVTKIFRVQFQDKEQGLQAYNGCYQKNEDAINRYEGFRRKSYESFGYNSESAKFGYCIDDRRWILFNGNNTNACEARGNDNELARSSKTDTFDFSTMFEEQWYTSSNTPLNLYFVEETGDIELNMTTCSSFINDGNCDSFFNEFDFQYDGGDCCAATCSGSNCGIGSLKNAFGATNKVTSGDGFPNCVDPDMVPITIRLDNIIRSSGIVELEPVKPLLFIDCDGSNVLNIYVDKSMENQTETIMVNDGADCTMTIRNESSNDSPIWYADYTILHGDEKSIESNSIVVTQSSSAKESTYDFKRTPECYFEKLSDYTDSLTVYTGINYDPTAKAIDWLMNDESENSMCEDPSILERYALAVIYFAAYNSSDYTLISTTRHCVWPSITCDEGAVIRLYMINKALIGSIASEIGMLISLRYLYLSLNALTGTIPSEIGLLTSLEKLYLEKNELTGSIPSEIGLLTSLEKLYLDLNKLTGTIPREIGLLTSLKHLYLSLNAFTGTIPSEIGLMERFSQKFMYRYPMVPRGIQTLSLAYNTLTGKIPSEIGLLTSLEKFYLDLNKLTGTIPSEIGLLTSLRYLYLSLNALTGTIPSEIGLLTQLETLSLENNELNGSIPSEIGLLTSLEKLYLDLNELTGTIPSEIGLLTSLENLDLSQNAFTGPIPSEIGLMTSLFTLYLESNELTGPIPSEIGLLTSLYDSNFDSNLSNHT